MRITNHMKRLGTVILAAAMASVVLTGCGGQTAKEVTKGNEISRAKTYSSLNALADDSDLVVVGKVTDTKVARDLDDSTDFTLVDIDVLRAVKGDASADTTLTVRQTGSAEQKSPETLLDKDDVFMLFLTKSGLAGEQASQYYVTGADAGVYELAEQNAQTEEKLAADDARADVSFDRVNTNSGDELPATLKLADVEEAAK